MAPRSLSWSEGESNVVFSRIVIAILLLLSAGAHAQDKTVQLKLSSWVPPAHPLNPALQAWGEDIDKASGGTIKSTLFPSEQLGKAMDHYDMARDGIADFAYVNPGYQPGRFPIIAAGELPFLMANAKGGSAALDAWYRKYAAAEMKDVHFCFAFVLDPLTFHSRTKKIVLPEDIRGTKVRPADATIGSFVTLLGGTNVQASAPEARETLERGVADAITFPWQSTILFGIDKVVKYDMDMPFATTTFVWVMNKPKYDAMSPAQKAVIDASLHHRMGGEGRQPLGRLGKCRPSQDRRRSRARCLQADARAGRRLAQGSRTAEGEMGRAGKGLRCRVWRIAGGTEQARRAG